MKEILPPVPPAEIITLVEESKKILKLMKCAFICPQTRELWRTTTLGLTGFKERYYLDVESSLDSAEYDASGMGIYWVLDINDCQITFLSLKIVIGVVVGV